MTSSKRNSIAAPPHGPKRYKAGRALAALLLAAGAALPGCEPPTPLEAQGRDVVRPALRFALDVPDGWTVRDLGGDVVLEIIAPGARPDVGAVEDRIEQAEEASAGEKAEGEAAPAEDARTQRGRVAVHVLVIKREGLTLEEWADGAVKAITDLQGDITVARREPARLAPTGLADGTRALVLDLENPRGIEPMKQRMLLAVTAERAYALVATGRRSEMAAAEDALRTCFETFTVW